ncbi:fungal-specific transcription factor domain-domain-containing protein [Clohesyomyces aquaticus]|uniref:Fungal-specific transcription factor domain-domain-containing protein n=1 Tax=Clohesyomyces aquaticus TaxID=1231657 RepID=A0A1Y1ZSL9_9PLEO|nr:fungal-specific transcription factor domain-domain-containing protein [Clohesyomyces aquaticus]
MTGLKRSLEESSHDGDGSSPQELSHVKPTSPTASSTSNSSASSFRNVSACNRCRLRKNRCDQRLPSCASCDKAGVKCVGYDPITKREIPRSYVFYLETRVAYLESLLQENSITFVPPEDFTPTFQSNGAAATKPVPVAAGPTQSRNGTAKQPSSLTREESDKYDREKLTKLVSNIGMVSVQGASDPRFLGSTSGISFARVVFAAVKSSVSGSSSERGSVRGAKALTANVADGGTSMRDSFFGLHTKPAIRQAPFPDRELASRLVELYFEHANPQIPILHRGEFMEMFERVYAAGERNRTSRESYMLNIVFAIGAGIIMGSSESGDSPTPDSSRSPSKARPSPPTNKKRRLAGQQHQPEEYHASAIVHLENFLGSTPAADRPDGFGAGLEELQAVLLLAGFALLRPVAPGLWYIVGVAVRLGVDLGLHYEDGVGIDGSGSEDQAPGKPEQTASGDNSATANSTKIDAKERGRRQWVRDLRRRLWWCVYSLDRLVSTCVGRPFGITDQVVTTEFPSMLDDRFITKEGFLEPTLHQEKPSYKVVAHHYFRLRLLQSEILQVLQHRQAQQARASGANQGNDFMHTKLPSPFLVKFESFRTWRQDIDRRLLDWRDSAPTQADAGVQFSPLFLELNYWQALIMLYRQSLVVPSGLAGELGTTDGSVGSPSIVSVDEREDEELVFLKVAEAGQKVLKLYRQLHRVHLVNYTFLATHHLFMAGISFLYAVWHSPVVRSHLSLDDVDFTVLAATSVLGDLIEKCPPAEACRDAFDRMSKATIQMCMSTTGFGPQALRSVPQSRAPTNVSHSPSTSYTSASEADARSDTEMTGFPPNNYYQQARKPIPKFDMNLRDLFSEDETDKRSFSRISNQISSMRPPPPPIKQESQQQMQGFNTDTLKISPQLRSHQQTFNFDPNLRPPQNIPSPQQQQQNLPLVSGMSQAPSLSPSLPQGSLSSPYQITNTLPYNNLLQNISSTYPDIGGFSELDFLDSFPVQGTSMSGGTGDAAGGLQDLGFGMGFGDGTHDWSDGNGYDLFDGFFFGPGGTGGGM